jgi:hypothetical protein
MSLATLLKSTWLLTSLTEHVRTCLALQDGETSPQEPVAAAQQTEQQPAAASRFAPAEVLDDGSMIYTMALLQSVDYEAVLAP